MAIRGRHARKPFMARLPIGVREQPALMFIGLMTFNVGVGFATGLTTSSVMLILSDTGLRIWGGVLATISVMLMVAVGRGVPSFEKLALRIYTCGLFSYAGWLLTVTDVRRSATTASLVVAFIGVAEIRIWFLKQVMRRATLMARELGVTLPDGR